MITQLEFLEYAEIAFCRFTVCPSFVLTISLRRTQVEINLFLCLNYITGTGRLQFNLPFCALDKLLRSTEVRNTVSKQVSVTLIVNPIWLETTV